MAQFSFEKIRNFRSVSVSQRFGISSLKDQKGRFGYAIGKNFGLSSDFEVLSRAHENKRKELFQKYAELDEEKNFKKQNERLVTTDSARGKNSETVFDFVYTPENLQKLNEEIKEEESKLLKEIIDFEPYLIQNISDIPLDLTGREVEALEGIVIASEMVEQYFVLQEKQTENQVQLN